MELFEKLLPELPESALRPPPSDSPHLREIVSKVGLIRHWAAHRVRKPTRHLLDNFDCAYRFLRLIRDDDRARWLSDVIDELETSARTDNATPRLLHLLMRNGGPPSDPILGAEAQNSGSPTRSGERTEQTDDPGKRCSQQASVMTSSASGSAINRNLGGHSLVQPRYMPAGPRPGRSSSLPPSLSSAHPF